MPDPSEVDLLKKQRAAFKGQLTNLKSAVATTTTIGGFESLLRRIQLIYDKYDLVQSRLEALDETFLRDRVGFEDDYGSLDTNVRNKIHELKKSEDVSMSATFLNTSTHEINNGSSLSVGIRLPEITLPSFSGREIEWLAFRDIFVDLIHSKSLESTVKFLYLISSIRSGTAFRIIESLPVTAENYSLAWKSLCDRYDNEITIQKIHVKELYEIRTPTEHSSKALEEFVDKLTKHYNALQSLKVKVTEWDLLLVHHITQRLDNATRIYIIKNSKPSSMLTFSELIALVRNRIRVLQALPTQGSHTPRNHRDQHRSVLNITASPLPVSSKSPCAYCAGSHSLPQCPGFSGDRMTPRLRFRFAKDRRICGNCLLDRHSIVECNHPPCHKCLLKHHELLHFVSDYPIEPKPAVVTSNESSEVPCPQDHNQDSLVEETSQGTTCAATPIDSKVKRSSQNVSSDVVFLGTAMVKTRAEHGQPMCCRGLLDSGSTMNFVTARTCSLLKAKKYATNKIISGIGASETTLKFKTYLTVASLTSAFEVTLKFYIIPTITNRVPNVQSIVHPISLPLGMILADPNFHVPSRVDLLLGAEIHHQLFKGHSIQIHNQLPPFYDSEFGYIACGGAKSGLSKVLVHPNNVVMLSVPALEDQIKKFWELENVPNTPVWSQEALLCEQHYADNVSRQPDGRYIVALPTKANISDLGGSQLSAQRQFFALERRLNRSEETRTLYQTFINEYLSLGHMKRVDTPCKTHAYYLPHHCVIKSQSTTTKLRVVFNASAKTTTNVSLNDCLMVGPTIQQDLFSILLRFRTHAIAFCGDITKMYRQIRIRDDQTDLQRILWRDNPLDPIQSFALNTVTYGTACAPFLATRTLRQLSIDERSKFPEAADVLEQDFYVDDVLTGSNSIADALQLKGDLVELLQAGGFELRKFFSNVTQLASESQSNSPATLLLGILWHTEQDLLEIPLNKLAVSSVCTKRNMLSEICQLFDPLGVCAPLIITAKLFVQAIWMEQNIGWDDPPPRNIIEKWTTFKVELQTVPIISIPRQVTSSVGANHELHGFCDASEKAYGCVLYVRSLEMSNQYIIRLLCAKSRVAPLKRETIPRLELCAAVLLSELVERIKAVIGVVFTSTYLWTDSQISLGRIKSDPSKYTIFVANRIAKIQSKTSPDDWYYVPSKNNPADIVSRGLMPMDFRVSSIWWNGPEFLTKPNSSWQSFTGQESSEEPIISELRKVTNPILIQQDQVDFDIFGRFSSVKMLIRVVAYMLRFSNHTRHSDRRQAVTSMHLQNAELDYASSMLVKCVQRKHFPDELQSLSKGTPISPKSSLLSLSVFIDQQGILRVGGRLRNAPITTDHKHPIVLPGHHEFSTLIARQEHVRLLHAAPQALLYNLRLTYWIIGGRNLCRSIVHNCIRCFRSKPQLCTQFMGDLPVERVTQSDRAFLTVGIDFCGPFLLAHGVRSKVKTKCYICLFVCFVTKAVHLEMVFNLSADAFIACLRRFVSRRGLCSKIYSDNATNFIGARTELQDLKRLFTSQSFQDVTMRYCVDHNIQWKTIPPRSPHFGGLWEAAIKSTKYHLTRVVGTASFTTEEFLTLITQIEACVNSRPLTSMSSDPNDLDALSPGHFIVGAPLTAIPEPSLLDVKTPRLSRFQRLQQLMQRFWLRWHTEYLSELQHRYKWNRTSTEFKIGSLVVLHDDNTPPMKWTLGRILELHPGNDGKTRVVSIKTAGSVLKRSVSRISVIPNVDANSKL